MQKGERRAVWIISGIVLGFLGLAAWGLYSNWRTSTTILLAGATTEVRIAHTEQARAQGLAGVSELPAGKGMLFVFDSDDKWAIWMKDMHIMIDVIWLSQDKKVVHIVKNVSPDTYPRQFMPSVPARYVLELPAGSVERDAISIGKQAIFELPGY